MDEKLSTLVQGHECLYNLQHQDYDNLVKDNSWKEIAELHAHDKELSGRTQHCRWMAGSWQGWPGNGMETTWYVWIGLSLLEVRSELAFTNVRSLYNEATVGGNTVWLLEKRIKYAKTGGPALHNKTRCITVMQGEHRELRMLYENTTKSECSPLSNSSDKQCPKTIGHTQVSPKEAITNFGWIMTPHPAHSPDLAPLDHHIYGR
jgi:hypothetical protein